VVLHSHPRSHTPSHIVSWGLPPDLQHFSLVLIFPNFITLVIISERHRLRLSSFSFNIRPLSSKHKLLSHKINTLPPQYTRQHDCFYTYGFPLSCHETSQFVSLFQVCAGHIDIPFYLLCIRAESHCRNGTRPNELPICPIYYGLMRVSGIDETACSNRVFRIRKFPSTAVLPFSQKRLVSLPFNTALHRLSRLSAISHAKVWLKNNRQLWRPLNSHTWVSTDITKIIESADTFNVLLTVHHIISV
jgi:hypothetical protein